MPAIVELALVTELTTAALVTADGTTTELEDALLKTDGMIWLAALLD